RKVVGAGGQLERLRDSLRQVDELPKLEVLAPVIDVALKFDGTSLLPVANRREVRPLRWPTFPEIDQHRRPGAGTQARQRRDATRRRADILAIRGKVVVLRDDRADAGIAVIKTDLVRYRVRAQVHQTADF